MSKKRGQNEVMLIKVDLEKPYDFLRWDFICDTFMDVGLPIHLIDVIMQCISTLL